MKPYTKTYLNYFGYDVSDFIPCEVCGAEAKDIHHVQARSLRKDLVNDISNLMALCRKCHTEKGDKKQFREYLQNRHNEVLNNLK
jgi:5-methylcytosine-specific restriction endonuclease McrA